MALITRISRLFTADLHAVLDRIEEPEAQLKQAIREMEDDCARSEQRLKRLTWEHENLQTSQTEIKSRLAQIDDELDVCFTSKKDDLARGLIKRKLETARHEKAVSGKLAETEKALEELRKTLEENTERLEHMRRKAEVFVDESRDSGQSQGGDYPWFERDYGVGDDEIEVAFLREKQRRSKS